MPKMKSRKSAAKRFSATGTGKLKRNKAFTSHILETKSPKRKRNLRKSTTATSADYKRIKECLPYI